MAKTLRRPTGRGTVSLLSPVAPKKKKGFKPVVLSRHPSHKPLRQDAPTGLPRMPFRSLIRFGSTTVLNDGHPRVEINSVDSIRNASDKLRMKRCFQQAGVATADWTPNRNEIGKWLTDGGKVVMKHRNGSRGRGLYLLTRNEDVERNLHSPADRYIFEKFYDYSREYRLHVTKDGCFCAWRKMLKNEVPAERRWIRNDSTCSWIGEQNPDFDRPTNWNTIIAECVKALNAVGLDIGGCDVKVQSAKDSKGNRRPEPKFFILEINSACSHSEITRTRYVQAIQQVLLAKKK